MGRNFIFFFSTHIGIHAFLILGRAKIVYRYFTGCIFICYSWDFAVYFVQQLLHPLQLSLIILLSVFRQVHSLFQSKFSTECDLVLPLSIDGIFSFPQGHPVASYVFFLVFPSLLSFPICFPQ